MMKYVNICKALVNIWKTSKHKVETADGNSTTCGEDTSETPPPDGQNKSKESPSGGQQHQKPQHKVDRNNLNNQEHVEKETFEKQAHHVDI